VASIYSTKLAEGLQAAGSNSDVYTVPSGYVAVIRSIQLYVVSAGAATAIVAHKSVSFIACVNTTAAFQGEDFEMRAVLDAGDIINVTASGVEFSYLISGYLLTP